MTKIPTQDNTTQAMNTGMLYILYGIFIFLNFYLNLFLDHTNFPLLEYLRLTSLFFHFLFHQRTNNTSNDGWNPYPSIAAATACVTSTFNRRNIRASFFLLM